MAALALCSCLLRTMSTQPSSAESTEARRAPDAPRIAASTLARGIGRALLFVWTILVACPVRYWPIENTTLDNTWVFAMNFGAAHELKLGRDLIWSTGPLGYLAFPNDIGSNLSEALGFQFGMWAILIAIFADLFYRGRLALRNLVFFSVFFSLSAPLYWFNLMGPENLLVAGVLVLLAVERQRGGLMRYAIALALSGVIPLIKLSAGMIAGGAILGFLAERAIRARGKIALEAALAIGIPMAVAASLCLLFMPADAIGPYLKGSLEIAGGYSSAMSVTGDAIEFAAMAEALIGIGAYLFVRTRMNRSLVRFLVALLALPLLLSVKHGFVRQDVHVLNFFCFAGLALALISILLPLAGERGLVAMLVLLNFGIISMVYQGPYLGFEEMLGNSSGFRAASMAWGALRLSGTRAAIAGAERNYSANEHVEPALRAIIGDQPLAPMSNAYSRTYLEGVNLRLYPVVQRYAAFTPYLDGLNAAWIRDKGPRFLLFDGKSIDHRHPWAETPAMWLEVYRWYDTRLLGERNLLLERRSAPRFRQWKSLGHINQPFPGEFEMPASAGSVFWTMRCHTNAGGTLRKLLFRVAEVQMGLDEPGGARKSYRVIPELLGSPLPGSVLPGSLAQFASMLDSSVTAKPQVLKLSFFGPGIDSYSSMCDVEFLTPTL